MWGVCVYIFLFVNVYLWTCVLVEVTGQCKISLSFTFEIVLSRQGLSIYLKLTNSVKLADQWAPMILLFLLSSAMIIGTCHQALHFIWMFKILIQATCFCRNHFVNWILKAPAFYNLLNFFQMTENYSKNTKWEFFNKHDFKYVMQICCSK